MFGILVCGHNRFPSGIVSALEMIMGKQEQLIAVDFPDTDTKTELEANLRAAIARFGAQQEILVLADLRGGSPFNVALLEALKDERLQVVFGTNLAIMIECVNLREDGLSAAQVIPELLKIGRAGIDRFDPASVAAQEDEFD